MVRHSVFQLHLRALWNALCLDDCPSPVALIQLLIVPGSKEPRKHEEASPDGQRPAGRQQAPLLSSQDMSHVMIVLCGGSATSQKVQNANRLGRRVAYLLLGGNL